jgi:hypothetical protein
VGYFSYYSTKQKGVLKMTCKQSYPSEVSMERIRNNLASFTEEGAQPQHQPTSMEDHKNLKPYALVSVSGDLGSGVQIHFGDTYAALVSKYLVAALKFQLVCSFPTCPPKWAKKKLSIQTELNLYAADLQDAGVFKNKAYARTQWRLTHST